LGNGMQTAIALCPAQEVAFRYLLRVLAMGNVCVLNAGCGLGRTTVLRRLHAETGGVFLNMSDLTDALRVQHPAALEETFERLVLDALVADDTVIVDDLHLLTCVAAGSILRRGLLDAPLTTLCTLAAEKGKKLV